MASVCNAFHWTPEYVMYEISVPCLMLLIDGMPDYSSDKSQDRGRQLSAAELQDMGIPVDGLPWGKH